MFETRTKALAPGETLNTCPARLMMVLLVPAPMIETAFPMVRPLDHVAVPAGIATVSPAVAPL
jgi:hypothetical protein